MTELGRVRLALKLAEHLRVRTVHPEDDDYTGDGHRLEHVVDGIPEAAEALSRDQDVAIAALRTALHALESYAHHNASPDLARSVAAHLGAVIDKLEKAA